MMKILFILIILSMLSGCGYLVNENDALDAARANGLKGVIITESHQIAPEWYGCGDNDVAGFEIRGKNANEQTVSAIVCMGWPFKGATVRYKYSEE
jgi:hypothetical protein